MDVLESSWSKFLFNYCQIAISIPSAFLTAETGPPLPTTRLLIWIHGPYSPLAMDFISVQTGVHVRREGNISRSDEWYVPHHPSPNPEQSSNPVLLSLTIRFISCHAESTKHPLSAGIRQAHQVQEREVRKPPHTLPPLLSYHRKR